MRIWRQTGRLWLFSTPATYIIDPTTGVWNERAEWRAKRGERGRFEARHRLQADASKPTPGPDAPLAGHKDEPVIGAEAEDAQAVHGERLVDPHAPAEVSPESPAPLGEAVEEPVVVSEAGESLKPEAEAEFFRRGRRRVRGAGSYPQASPGEAAHQPARDALGRGRCFKPRRIPRLEPIRRAARNARIGRRSGSGCGAAQTR